MTPTEEQGRVLELARTGESVAVQAGAGSGKTSTLVMLAEDQPKKGLFMAYNKAIATDAEKKFPAHVSCRTGHSLAYGPVGSAYRGRLNGKRMSSHDIAALLGLSSIDVETPGGRRRLLPHQLAGLVVRGMDNFYNSDATVPSRVHVPAAFRDVPASEAAVYADLNARVRVEVEPYLAKMWADVQDPRGRLPMSHDAYLAMWVLSEPTLDVEVVYADELQDSTRRIVQLLRSQAARGVQVIGVGDTRQCQPPGTLVRRVVTPPSGGRAAVTEQVPIESLADGDLVVTYLVGGSEFRFTGRPVRVAARPYDGDLVTVTTASGRVSKYTPNHWCLASTKGLAGSTAKAVYLMERDGRFRVGKCSLFYRGAFGPVTRARQEGADRLWVLSVHDTDAEALLAESVVSHRYGVPQLTFTPVNAGAVWTADLLDRFWSDVDNAHEAKQCIVDHGREFDFPFWQKGDHYTVVTRRPCRIAAANLLDGMMVRLDGPDGAGHGSGGWESVTVGRERFTGDVYSLDVDVEHNYVADGIVTYNSIYKWRGSVEGFDLFGFAHEASLTQSFRFGPEIAAVANEVLALLGEFRVEGLAPSGTVGPLEDPGTVLCRTNAVAVSRALAALEAGRKPCVVGGVADVVRFAKAAVDLQAGKSTEHPEIAWASSWDEVVAYARGDDLGTDLLRLVRLVDEWGPQVIIDRLAQVGSDPAKADVVLSTAHKAKGLEWDGVALADDFGSRERIKGEEACLLYVAVTRAMRHLDVSDVAFFAPPAAEQPVEEVIAA